MERRALILLANAGVLWPSLAIAESTAVQLVVIVAKNSPMQDVGLPDLRRLFGGEPVADSEGHNLIPFNHPPRSPDRVGFDRDVLGMDAGQVAKYWVDRKIRGQPGPPRTVTSLNILLGVVSRLPGAIGYLQPQYLSSEVRALKVSGKSPNAADYPLFYND